MLTALLPFDKIPTLLFEFQNLTGRFLLIFPGGNFWEQMRKSPCCPHGDHFPVQIHCYVASLLLVSTWLLCATVLRRPIIYKLTSFPLFSGLAVFPASLFSVYVIRCNLGLLCYWIFPQCFASMTHSVAFIPHVCASPKVFVSLSWLAVWRSMPLKKTKQNKKTVIKNSQEQWLPLLSLTFQALCGI